MTFDPAASFLLGMNWENLYEPSSSDPTIDPPYRCKGCDELVVRRDREKHYHAHRRQEARRIERERIASRTAALKAARKARALKAAG